MSGTSLNPSVFIFFVGDTLAVGAVKLTHGIINPLKSYVNGVICTWR